MSLLEWLQDIVASLNESSEAKAEREALREEIAKGHLKKLKEKKPDDILFMLSENQLLNYLIDDGIAGEFRAHLIENVFMPMSGLALELKEFREKLKKASTKEELELLKLQIISSENLPQNEVSTQSDNTQTPEENKDWNQTSDSVSESWPVESYWNSEIYRSESFSGFEEQRPYIQRVLASAQKEIGKPYVRWGSTAGWKGFDCSGLRNCAFWEQGMKFPTRFTASLFDKTDVNLTQEQVRVWDFMYREEQPGKKKHNPIYHIEMVLWKPFQKDGKRIVKTIWSSTDKGVLDENGNKTNKNGVGYRLREITEYRHFGRPPYYAQLAKQEKKGEFWTILASMQAPTEELA